MSLKQRITELIAETGPIPVSQYMALCLFDPADGYYTTREPFGAKGDFTTAPEISQMFGELAAVWLASAWQAAGAPQDAILAEIGPGRGTLARDMLRTLARIAPDLTRRVALIETSPRLTAIQKETLGATSATWHRDIGELPGAPLFIVGNELFDAIPIRQFVKTPQGWRERCVGLDADGALTFVAGPGTTDAALPDAPNGAIFEIAPARNALMQEIAERIARDGGAGLFIDYGHLQTGVGDTLQAMRAHAHVDVLATPGEADLTSHVDFAALGAAAGAGRLETRAMTQARFLLGMGLLERAGQLGAGGDAGLRERLRGEVERLAGPDEMGELFKVLMVGKDLANLPPQ
ncbi:class I SAM-dependent methyltransferase [Aliihoeflea sp. 2WW]|uniref:class I SAM-dependent methyltransferase n=1 Tax=Aliihoeflea sp. 2WW TaxID=1381123 RepID=UPI0004A22670|nr:class I SAM-dependent methyltransferase [Aliihoeflea sp. 2WW]